MTSNSVSKNFAWNAFEKVVNFLNSLFIIFVLTSYFGVETFGIYSYVISAVSLFTFIAYFGLEVVIVNEMLKKNYKKSEIFGTSLILLTSSALLAFILICTFNFLYIDDNNISLLIYVYAGVVFASPINVFQLHFNSKIDIVDISKLKILCLLIIFLTKILFVFLGLGIVTFITIELISILLLSLISLSVYAYRRSSFRFKFNSKIFFDLLKKGFPLMLSAGAILIYGKVDTIFIEYFLDMSSVGVYSVAIRISELWYVVPMSISAILFPLIVKAKNQSEESYINQIFISSQVMIVVCTFFTFILFFLVSNLISHYLAEGYSEVGNLIKIIAWCGPFVGLGYINGGYMVAENFLYLTMMRNIYGMLVNIILNIILIPIIGLYGAALSTLIAVIFTSMLSLSLHKKTYQVFAIQLKAFLHTFNIVIFLRNIKHIEAKHREI